MQSLKDLSSLQGRYCLITGACGHLGKTFAETLAELGASLILVDLPNSDFSFTSNISLKYDIDVIAHECDLEQPRDRDRLVSYVNDCRHELNSLINNAAFTGTSTLDGWIDNFENQKLSTWQRALEVNLTSCFDLCKGLSQKLSQSSGANIVNIGSIYGELGPDWRLYDGTNMGNPAAYAASKGGLIQLTKWMATTLAPRIRVNAISPGGIYRFQHKSFVSRYISRTPMQRMASEEDFKGAIAYLATDLSSYVTGQVLKVDGGWGVW